MGLIRGGLLFTAGILLLASLVMGNFFLTLNYSLSYDNIQPKLVSFIENITDKGINLTDKMNESIAFAELYCLNKTEYVFNYKEYAFELPCNIISLGVNATINYSVNQLVEKVYYKNYNCSLFECFKEKEYFFLISEQSKDYWGDKFYFLLIVSLIIIAAMFFFVEKKTDLFFAVGFLLVLSSLPFMKISNFLSFLDSSLLQFIPILFSESYRVFLKTFTLGIIIIAVGILLKFFNFWSFILQKFGRNKKEVTVKQEPPKKEEVPKKVETPSSENIGKTKNVKLLQKTSLFGKKDRTNKI